MTWDEGMTRIKDIRLASLEMERWKWEMIANAVARHLEDMLVDLNFGPDMLLYEVARQLEGDPDVTETEREFRELHAAAVSLEHELAVARGAL